MEIIAEDMPEILDEARYVYVVRDRKKKKRLAPRPGYKVVGGKYKKITGSEKVRRKIGARKAAKKRKAKGAQIKRKRKLSMAKRKSLGLSRRKK